jgi:hypothetical protein
MGHSDRGAKLKQADHAAETGFSTVESDRASLPCGAKRPAWLEVRNIDEKGNPRPGRSFVVRGQGLEVSGTVDENGYALVENLKPGEYEVEFTEEEEDEFAAMEVFFYDDDREFRTPCFDEEAEMKAADKDAFLLPQARDGVWVRWVVYGPKFVTEAKLEITQSEGVRWRYVAPRGEIDKRGGWVYWDGLGELRTEITDPELEIPPIVVKLSVKGSGTCMHEAVWCALDISPARLYLTEAE